MWSCRDELVLDQCVEALGKIQIHDVVGLHHDIGECGEVEGNIEILHEIQKKNFDVAFSAEGTGHGLPPFT